MRNLALKFILGICLMFSSKSFSQTAETFDQIGRFLNDATWYADKYITPATDGAVYQASSGWMSSPKKRKVFTTTLGVYGNFFKVPTSDRTFTIQNSDFSFFTIQNSNGDAVPTATVPTALGPDTQYYLVGAIDGNPIRMAAPNGVDQEIVSYPYLQGSLALWKGFEIVAKYSTKVKLKKGDFQVYGFGLKHNLSQYSKYLQRKKIHLAALALYSKENISFDFVDTQTSYGNLGINRISSDINTFQFQIGASKEWKKFELMANIISNRSDFKYKFTGERGQIEDVIPVQYILNEKLKDIYKTKYNCIGEISGRYQISKIFVQSSLAFGKFVNSNLSIQYEF
ncbi:hypothetical protein CLV55_11212 [Flavobacterium aciduliphilum]|uniref:Uncharacterized protein n=2 Tax=Flavobacterium aciduliphilum TaxID=1101402 RepID=A0A328Y918_9FLAO|nr:hypothetical protein CLV55_11212 [Flavobacterium aciduliphilum]